MVRVVARPVELTVCVCVLYIQVIFKPACTHRFRLFLLWSKCLSSSAWREAILLCSLSSFISVSVSPPCSLLLILSHSYGGRDENGCLIMQRGQPIKGPEPSDLKAYSEHSWREREREREGDGGERGRRVGVWLLYGGQVTSHPLTTGVVLPIIVPDRLMYRQGDEWIEWLEGGKAERCAH